VNNPIRKILVNIDGTEQSIVAAQYAICLARLCSAELTACYVVNIKALNELVKAGIFLKEEQVENERELETDADNYLTYVHELAIAKGITINKIRGMGSPNQEIAKIVREQAIDLLVIAELSRISSRRDEFYDENERAMRSAHCSVLIVKNTEHVEHIYESLV